MAPDEAAATVAAFEEAYMQMLHRRLRLEATGDAVNPGRLNIALIDLGHSGTERRILSLTAVKLGQISFPPPAPDITVQKIHG